MKKTLILICALCCLSLPLLAQEKTDPGKTVPGKSVSRVVAPEFRALLPQLEAKTAVPVLLPAEFPSTKFLPRIVPSAENATGLTLASYLDNATDSEYDLTLDITPDCAGRPNCNYGHVAGRKNSAAQPVSTKFIEFDAAKARPVELAAGIKGFYLPAPDNPRSTAGAAVFWLDGRGNQYAVSLKRASQEDVTAAANSMINNFAEQK